MKVALTSTGADPERLKRERGGSSENVYNLSIGQFYARSGEIFRKLPAQGGGLDPL